MEGKQVGQVLPDDLVEMIVARLPFPLIFKARGLSKSWLARFSSIFTLDDPGKKLLATSFQKRVCERSNTWKSFCPVCIVKGNSGLYLFGYDSASERWQEMPSLSFLPKNFLRRTNLEMDGPLLYALPLLGLSFETRGEQQIFVANILTQSWKEVSPQPNLGWYDVYFQKLVSYPSSETYKVIRFSHACGVHVYDSKSDTWSSQQLNVHMPIYYRSTSAYLNGILYICSIDWGGNLLAYDVEDWTFDVYKLYNFEGWIRDSNIAREISSFNLFVCGINLLMVLSSTTSSLLPIVLKIDLGSRKLLKVAWGAPASLSYNGIYCPVVCDGNSIFFKVLKASIETEIISYNLDMDKWKSPVPANRNLRRSGKIYQTRRRDKALKVEEQEEQKVVERPDHGWGAICFQTGLHPFVEV